MPNSKGRDPWSGPLIDKLCSSFEVLPSFGPPGREISGGFAQGGIAADERSVSDIGGLFPIALHRRNSLWSRTSILHLFAGVVKAHEPGVFKQYDRNLPLKTGNNLVTGRAT